jgi:hypothetical protein
LLSGRIAVPAIPGRSSSISFLRINAPCNQKEISYQHNEATGPTNKLKIRSSPHNSKHSYME